MPDAFTIISLPAVDDVAPANGFGDRWEARVARDDLAAERTGVTLFRLFPGKRSPFTHRHTDAEEIYVVLSGSGRVKLDDELFDVGPLDSMRVAPTTARAFEAGQDGLELLAFGPHHPGDGEPVKDPWTDWQKQGGTLTRPRPQRHGIWRLRPQSPVGSIAWP
jgi:mannose-6-phosphate isomerase-like protein (cupin superfamily)